MIKKNNQPICQTDESGTKRWIINGQLHREDGPAIEYNDSSKVWFLHGQRHRIDGPAIEWSDGDKAWYHHGQLHRLDGPAYQGDDGFKQWFYHGERILCSSQEEFERLIKLKALW